MITTRLRLAAVAVATFSVLAIGASPALADDTVTQNVAAGSRSASVANLNLGRFSASHADQESAGTSPSKPPPGTATRRNHTEDSQRAAGCWQRDPPLTRSWTT